MRVFTPFLFIVLFAKFEFAGSRKPKKIQRLWPFPWKWSIWQNPDQERTNQNARIYFETILPYNTFLFSFHLCSYWPFGNILSLWMSKCCCLFHVVLVNWSWQRKRKPLACIPWSMLFTLFSESSTIRHRLWWPLVLSQHTPCSVATRDSALLGPQGWQQLR